MPMAWFAVLPITSAVRFLALPIPLVKGLKVPCGYVGVHGFALVCADTEIQSRREVRGMRLVQDGRRSVD